MSLALVWVVWFSADATFLVSLAIRDDVEVLLDMDPITLLSTGTEVFFCIAMGHNVIFCAVLRTSKW